jgi:nucleoside phosphorylase
MDPLHDRRTCAAVAATLKAQEYGPRMVAGIRPRRMNALMPSRLPLSLLLQQAALEHRVVRHGAGLAVLEPPGNARDDLPRSTPQARRLDRLDQWWDVLTFGGPPLILLCLAALTAFVLPQGAGRIPVTLGLVALALLWTTTQMTAFVVVHLYAAWRAVERTRDAAAHAAGPLLGRHWSVSILHCPDQAAVPELLRRTRERADELAATLPRWQQHKGKEALLVRLDACTTADTEQAVLDVDGGLPLRGTTPRLLRFGDGSTPALRKRPQPPRGITLLLLSAPVVILLCAPLVADRERQACRAADACPEGGLTTFGRAATWMFDQLFLRGDSPGLSPARLDTRIFGYLLPVLGVTLLVCVVVAAARYLSFQEHGLEQLTKDIQDDVENKRPTIGIVTALPEEAVPMRALMDGITRYRAPGDLTSYSLGTIPSADGNGARHHVVLATMVEAGNDRAATTVANLARSFPTVNSIIMCGIAAGIPSPSHPTSHVRLGDVVVGTWAVIDYDHVDQRPDGATIRGGMPTPSWILRAATVSLRQREIEGDRPWEEWLDISHQPRLAKYARPAVETDILHDDETGSVIPHPDVMASDHRPGYPKVHYGRIGSSDRALRSSLARDRIAASYGVLALEMEGKGLGTASEAHSVDWLVVRGISDYGDAQTNSAWRHYAALTAAAYVRALLGECFARRARGGQIKAAGPIHPDRVGRD